MTVIQSIKLQTGILSNQPIKPRNMYIICALASLIVADCGETGGLQVHVNQQGKEPLTLDFSPDVTVNDVVAKAVDCGMEDGTLTHGDEQLLFGPALLADVGVCSESTMELTPLVTWDWESMTERDPIFKADLRSDYGGREAEVTLQWIRCQNYCRFVGIPEGETEYYWYNPLSTSGRDYFPEIAKFYPGREYTAHSTGPLIFWGNAEFKDRAAGSPPPMNKPLRPSYPADQFTVTIKQLLFSRKTRIVMPLHILQPRQHSQVIVPPNNWDDSKLGLLRTVSRKIKMMNCICLSAQDENDVL